GGSTSRSTSGRRRSPSPSATPAAACRPRSCARSSSLSTPKSPPAPALVSPSPGALWPRTADESRSSRRPDATAASPFASRSADRTTMATILVVDDEPSARTTLGPLLRKRSHRVTEVGGVATAVKALIDEAFEVIMTDLRMPDGDGLDVLRAARAHCPEADVILLTAYAGWESAKEAIQLGACDYFEKGHEPDELLHRIDKALAEKALRRENANLRAQVQDRYALTGLVTGSARMAQVLDLVRRVAPTDATVLIHGESGSGKEVIAKAIHHASPSARVLRRHQLCGAPRDAPRVGALRPHQRGGHGRGHGQEGSVRGSPWRDALARRDRRDAPEPAGQAPAHATEPRA